MNRRHRASGFTLIELAFVVSIIGILASVALPAYQDYTRRARASEALLLSEIAREGVVEYYGRWGRFPADNAAAGLQPADAYRGRVTRSMEVKEGLVRVAVVMEGSPGRAYALYMRPLLGPSQAGPVLGWTCGPQVPPGFTAIGAYGADALPQAYLPGSCK